MGYANSRGGSRALRSWFAAVESGVSVLGRREAASWSCRWFICCSRVRSGWRRCGCARVSSRNSRSWCSATSWRCFAVKSPVRGWARVTASPSRRPAGCSAGRVGSHSSCNRTRFLAGIASLCDGGGRTPAGGLAGPHCRRRSVGWCCGSRVRIRAGATSGSSVNSPVSARASRQRRSRRSCGKRACPRRVLAHKSAGAISCALTLTRSSPATSSRSKRSGSDASTSSSSSSSVAAASTLQAAPRTPTATGPPSKPDSLPGRSPSERHQPAS